MPRVRDLNTIAVNDSDVRNQEMLTTIYRHEIPTFRGIFDGLQVGLLLYLL